MPLRFYRRFRAGPIRLNLSKSGISYSFGGRHAWLTLGHGHVRASVGVPGTGLYWYQQRRLPIAPKVERSAPPPDQSLLWTPALPAPGPIQRLVIAGMVGVILAIALMLFWH